MSSSSGPRTRATAEGRLLHERVDAGRGRDAGPACGSRAALRCARWRWASRAGPTWWSSAAARRAPFPVEYKRGKPKPHRADEVQLCAQAMCLEEMLGVPVPEGALFYGETRRRTRVAFDAELRALTARVAAETRAMIAAGRTPPPVLMPALPHAARCMRACRPERLQRPPSVARWLAAQLAG